MHSQVTGHRTRRINVEKETLQCLVPWNKKAELGHRLSPSLSGRPELCTALKNQPSLAPCYVGDNVSHKSCCWNAAPPRCQEANIIRRILRVERMVPLSTWSERKSVCSKSLRRAA